ncbi:MAG TPA: amino acid ABC transporter permease [Planctomycetota bacterium]|nr:amino acid ABC transporter permease [Planctomycetota bacterium]
MEFLAELSDRVALPYLIKAAQYPLLLTAVSMPLAVLFGLLLALMRTSRKAWLSWPAATYIEIVRGTPLLVQMFLVYYSLPLLNPALTLSPIPCGILCLSANYAAYEAEVHRAGLQAIDRGQMEAALSIGMSRPQAFRLIIFPQAFRVVLPPVINDSIAMLKDSCLTSVIGVPELLDRAKAIGKERYNYEEMYVAASLLYMIMSLAFYFLGKWVESRLKTKGGTELEQRVHGH